MALKHKLFAQYQTLTDVIPTTYALVETDTDYVVASGYHGHGKEWEQGYYFPKASGEDALKNAYIAFTSIVVSDRLTILEQ